MVVITNMTQGVKMREYQMKNDYIRTLYEISEQTKIPVLDLFTTFSMKTTDYVGRDLLLNKTFDNGILIATEQKDRALNVMEEYASRKLNYDKDNTNTR